MTATVTLPPALRWSASLAEHLDTIDGADRCHGLVDATDPARLLAWSADEASWMPLAEMPADAATLTAQPVDEVEWMRRVVAAAEVVAHELAHTEAAMAAVTGLRNLLGTRPQDGQR